MSTSEIGRVVICRAGREKGRSLLVVAADENYVYLADGVERKLSSPKRKNRIHVWFTKKEIDMTGLTDKQLRCELGN